MSAELITDTLLIEREIHASIDDVFNAWTHAEILAQWFGPKGMNVADAKLDCRAGGEYSITLHSADEKHITHNGKYLEVSPPHTLIFTWVLNNQECEGSMNQNCVTLVELNFFDKGYCTLLRLRHEKLPNQVAHDGHRFGWESSLERLGGLLA